MKARRGVHLCVMASCLKLVIWLTALSGGKTASLQNYSSHSSSEALVIFSRRPGQVMRWRGKNSGFMCSSQSGICGNVVCVRVAGVLFLRSVR